ncbi:MAG: glutathione S-transferase N-terminal domain-containing protein [Burkholderiales bacterium]
MMTLFSGATCPRSHRCRIVLFEKGMDFHVEYVDSPSKAEDLAVINPHNQVPVLVDRDVVLYEANIINEYIDDRFPHPQLMPSDPGMRARARLMLLEFERDLFCHVDTLEANTGDMAEARTEVAAGLAQLTPIFSRGRFLLGDELSMLDIAMASLLWRLPRYGIDLGRDTASLDAYLSRLFDRPAFREATTAAEKAMRR